MKRRKQGYRSFATFKLTPNIKHFHPNKVAESGFSTLPNKGGMILKEMYCKFDSNHIYYWPPSTSIANTVRRRNMCSNLISRVSPSPSNFYFSLPRICWFSGTEHAIYLFASSESLPPTSPYNENRPLITW